MHLESSLIREVAFDGRSLTRGGLQTKQHFYRMLILVICHNDSKSRMCFVDCQMESKTVCIWFCFQFEMLKFLNRTKCRTLQNYQSQRKISFQINFFKMQDKVNLCSWTWFLYLLSTLNVFLLLVEFLRLSRRHVSLIL